MAWLSGTLDDTTTASAYKVWPGGDGMIQVSGTWDGATVRLERKNTNGVAAEHVAETTFTEDGMSGFRIPSGTEIRVNRSTAGSGSEDVDYQIDQYHTGTLPVSGLDDGNRG